MHSLGVYVKSNLLIAGETIIEDENKYCVFVSLYILLYIFIFFLYRSPSSSCFVFKAVSSNIDQALILQPSANIMVCSDFNAHNTEWLCDSHTNDVTGLFCQEVAMAQDLTHILDFPTHSPDRDDHQP